jgi:trimeric autotransporter adhesin
MGFRNIFRPRFGSKFSVVAVAALSVVAICVNVLSATAQESARAATAPRLTEPAQATVPQLVQFTGTLKDSFARPFAGVASVTFAIYAEQDGSSALWSETQNVLADANGHYSVLLGAASANGVPASLFGTGESRWLGVTIARQAEMPRALLASVPYALKAQDAETLGGLPASSFVTTQQLAASNAHTIATPTTIVAAAAPLAAGTNAATNAALDASNDSAAQSVTQATVTGAGTANYLPLWTSGSNLGASKIYQANGGFVGINTNTPLQQLDVNGNSIFRGSFQLAPQGIATTSTGQPSHSFQWQGSVFNSSTHAAQNEAFGFRAVPATNNTSNPTTKLDLFYGPGGGTLNDTGLSISNSGIITFVPGQILSGSSANLSGPISFPGSDGENETLLMVGNSPFLSSIGSSDNIQLGPGTGNAAMTGQYDIAIGQSSMSAVTTGGQNVAIGTSSLRFLTTGFFSTAVGDTSLERVTTGNQNTALGAITGNNITTGSNDTVIGVNSNVLPGTISNSTAIGANSCVTEPNAVVLGQASCDPAGYLLEPTFVGIGTSHPRSTLDIVNATGSTSSNPDPTLTLTSANLPAAAGSVAIDFNTYDPGTTGTYVPTWRLQAVNGGNFSAELDFFVKKPGAMGNPLTTALQLDPTGDLHVIGNLYVDGQISKGSGTFKIDDPIDPANKYLSHSFVESPDMMNIYNGNMITDASGLATVEMPAWFEALNQDFRYQLTTIGQRSDAWIDTEITGNKFTIRTDKPNVKVSWQVTGVRHDAYAVAHRTAVEEAKPASEQGHYLHPELFGASDDQRVAHVFGPAPKQPVVSETSSAVSAVEGRQ